MSLFFLAGALSNRKIGSGVGKSVGRVTVVVGSRTLWMDVVVVVDVVVVAVVVDVDVDSVVVVVGVVVVVSDGRGVVISSSRASSLPIGSDASSMEDAGASHFG